ncbi:hypothetical protein DVQ04_15395 [Yersinia enterocolitica]|nr:hypothetical protein [Yersinia enterocolitica]
MKQSGCLACSITIRFELAIEDGWYSALIILTAGYIENHQPARTAPKNEMLKLSMQNAYAVSWVKLILMVISITAAAHHDAAHRGNN